MDTGKKFRHLSVKEQNQYAEYQIFRLTSHIHQAQK